MFNIRNMINLLIYITLTLQICICTKLEVGDSQIDIASYAKGAGTCEEVCEKTYTLHTYPKAEHLSCCKRGCRFYSMIDVLGTVDNANDTHHSCVASCEEAYKVSPEKLACYAGCDSQQNFASKDGNQPQTAHVLQPLIYVRTVYSNMVGHVSQFISSSWTLYVQQDDGKVIVSKDTPDVLQEIISEESTGDIHEMDEFGNTLLISGSGTIKDFTSNTLRRDEFIKMQQAFDQSTGKSSSEKGVDWLSCVSRQSGVPRKLLLLFLLLTIMVMIWLCCATAATAQEQRVKNLQVNNDLSYLLLCNSSEKVKIQPYGVKDNLPPPPPCYDFLEAPPLPLKEKPLM